MCAVTVFQVINKQSQRLGLGRLRTSLAGIGAGALQESIGIASGVQRSTFRFVQASAFQPLSESFTLLVR